MEAMATDHQHAKTIAKSVENSPGISLESGLPETNLVWIKIDPRLGSAQYFARRLKEHKVHVAPLGEQVVRACTHRDLSESQIKVAAKAIEQTAESIWSMSP